MRPVQGIRWLSGCFASFPVGLLLFTAHYTAGRSLGWSRPFSQLNPPSPANFLCLKPRSPSPCSVGWSWSPSTVPIGRQCSEDVSGDVAHELRRKCDLRLREGRFHLQEFAERHEGLFHNIQLPLPVRLVSLGVSGQEARWVRRQAEIAGSTRSSSTDIASR